MNLPPDSLASYIDVVAPSRRHRVGPVGEATTLLRGPLF